jgi:hypothetical protein
MTPLVPDKNEIRKPQLLNEVRKVLRFDHWQAAEKGNVCRARELG